MTLDMLEVGFKMRGEIIWQKDASRKRFVAWGSWLSPSNPIIRESHEYILLFSKETLKLDKKEKTMSKPDFKEWTESVWKMSPASARRIGHPAPFPIELPKRLIRLFSYEGAVVLDPFMGSGTTAVAAKALNRKYMGYEISKEYVELSNGRLLQDYLW